MYSVADYEKAIENTPKKWKGLPLRQVGNKAICMSRRYNKETKTMRTLYSKWDNGIYYFVVENGIIL